MAEFSARYDHPDIFVNGYTIEGLQEGFPRVPVVGFYQDGYGIDPAGAGSLGPHNRQGRGADANTETFHDSTSPMLALNLRTYTYIPFIALNFKVTQAL